MMTTYLLLKTIFYKIYWKIFLVEILDKLIVTLPALRVRLWLPYLYILSTIKCNEHELELYNRLGFSLGLIGSWYL